MTIPQIFIVGYIFVGVIGFFCGRISQWIKIDKLERAFQKKNIEAAKNFSDLFFALTDNVLLKQKISRLTPKRDPIGRFMGKK